MKKRNIVRYTADEIANLPDTTDWEAVDALTNEDIEQAIAEDPDAAPLLDAEFFRTATFVMPGEGEKVAISIRVDPEVLDYFKAQGPGYQTRINAVLRTYVRTQRAR